MTTYNYFFQKPFLQGGMEAECYIWPDRHAEFEG